MKSLQNKLSFTKIEVYNLVSGVEQKYAGYFATIDEISFKNQEKVLDAFQKARVESRHFAGSSGYGYGDEGRYKLEEVFSLIFGSEASLVRVQFGSATHAIVVSLRSLLKPNDILVSVTGKPYDTVYNSIKSTGQGSALEDYGVKYADVDLINSKTLDYKAIEEYILSYKPKVVYLQKSRGYMWREALTIDDIKHVTKLVKSISPDTIIFVDNCYGEFVEDLEPCDVGADVCVGSLIKNPGGSLSPTGAYIVGSRKCVNAISSFFYSVNINDEIGSYEPGYRLLFQGLFMAPHIVAKSMKCALLFSGVYSNMGYEVMPDIKAYRGDITQSIKLNSNDELIKFCKGIQEASPVDSHLMPEPWEMPGYSDKIIMAAGTFVQGASIELSADAPVSEKPPFIVYLQGGITYEHCKLALIKTLTNTPE